MSVDTVSIPRRLRAKPPPIDLSVIPSGTGSTPNRIQLWPASQQRVAPEALSGPGSPTPLHEDGHSPGVALSPLIGEPVEGGWAGLPAHILEVILAALRDSQGRWPSRKVLFSVCGVCKLWRRVGHTLFFSNVWQHHSDVIVHPSQLFTLSPHPLRLHTSDHLLRCFVHRTPCSSPGLSPRFGRLWRFALYLGSDHRGLRTGPGPGTSGGAGASSSSSSWGLTGGTAASPTNPQLLMLAQQTGRRTYQLLLGPSAGTAAASSAGRGGPPTPSLGWRSPRREMSGGGGGGGSGGDVESGCHGQQGPADCTSRRDSGIVAVLRSNIRCSHYELIPESSCPWARRLISVAGYMAPQGGPPQPLIQLEYRLRVRGIMLPRRMKVQVPVPHSLQRVVQNPLYDMHEPVEDGPGPTAAGWPPVLGAADGNGGAGGPAAAAAVMAPPAPGGAAGGGGGGGVPGDGNEGLMDNLEDILEAAMRTEPLLFANMVDAAVVRPADDDEGPGGGGAGAGGADGAGAGRARPQAAGGVAGRAAALLRRTGSLGGGLGSSLLRGFLNRQHANAAGGGGAGAGDGNAAAGGVVQWWGPGSPGSARRSASGGADGSASGSGAAGDAVGGWSAPSPTPARVVRLQNKAPHWNDALMCWCLNFRGRVKMASVKNFQLMCSADTAGRCVMQFGKVEDGIYVLDFNPCVLTAAQAFAAALSTFETKYLL